MPAPSSIPRAPQKNRCHAADDHAKHIALDFFQSLEEIAGDGFQWLEIIGGLALKMMISMRTFRFGCALLAAACCLFPNGAMAGSRLVQRLSRGEPQSVVVYGTSLTQGNLWPAQMQSWLANTYAGQLTLTNSGLSGLNSKDGTNYLDSKVLVFKPDAVFIEFAMNDAFTNYANPSFNLSVAEARSNLNQMIDRILTNRSDTEIILQTMNTVWDSTNTASVSATMRPHLADYYQMYRDVAAERGLLLIDNEPNWRAVQTNDPGTFANYVYDGTHPVTNGYTAVVMPLLKRKLVGEVSWYTNQNSGPVLLESAVCVYGDTAAAVCAAVQASRQGKKCVLVAPFYRLGGMTSGGLGQTDTGSSTAYIGGLAREFYRRIYWYYRDNTAWNIESRSAYVSRSATDPDEANHIQVTFEPKVAERIFEDMLAEAGVTAINARLLRNGGAGVKKSGQTIQEIATDDGKYFVRAGAFIDASYEGDLMAEAGVPYTVGREANTNYGETINGIEVSKAAAHQLPNGVDPYVQAGNPASGLLPGVEPAIGGADGTGDARLQSYNFRMCLTDIASNRAMVSQPAGYNEDDYQLLFRAMAAGMGTNFFSKGAMPNRKTDSNNNGGFSTDFIGGNYSITGGWNYADASYAKRDEIIAAHRRYQMGFLWALQNSTNISLSIRSNTAWSAWGLPLDEFGESGNWPGQLYVREARRMLGTFVMTQHQINQTPGYVVTDPVGEGLYTMDSHHVQRYVTTNGFVQNEGDVQVAVSRGAYGISYRSLVPPTNSVNNLLVPVCLSASHIALGSIRMEPVYMLLGHAAASAAVQALNDSVAMQSVDYAKLRAQLVADAQIVPGSSTSSVSAIIVDNADGSGVAINGAWVSSTASPGYYGANYLHDNNANKGSCSVRFTPTLPTDGLYTVYARWTTNPNRATNAPIDVIHPGGSNTFFVNQQNNNGVWMPLLTTNFLAGTGAYVVVRNGGTTNYVIADAVQFASGAAAVDTVRVLASDASAEEAAGDSARFTVARDTVSALPLTVFYSVGGTAAPTNDYAALAGSVTIPANSLAAPIVVQPVADNLAEGDETVIVSLVSNANYLIGSPTSAVATIHDPPADAWRFSKFTPSQLTNSAISGALADPDGDGRANLLERALGGNPLAADASSTDPAAFFDTQGGGRRFVLEYKKASSSLSYTAEWTASFTNSWSAAGVSDEFYIPAHGDFGRSVTPAAQDTLIFLRLVVHE